MMSLNSTVNKIFERVTCGHPGWKGNPLNVFCVLPIFLLFLVLKQQHHRLKAKVTFFRGPRTHPKSRNTKKHRVYTNSVRKVFVNFCLLPCDASQEPNRDCSENLVQMNFFIFGWIFPGGFSSSDFSDASEYCKGSVLYTWVESTTGKYLT